MHPLDRPVWSALMTRQSRFAEGGVGALRFPVEVSPLAGGTDAHALAELIAPGDDISLLERAPAEAPGNVTVTRSALCFQMIAPRLSAGGATFRLETLGDGDAPEMLALATLTRPGPFRAHTHTLGRFLGIREAGRLVAMAGERLCADGFHEVSAVCTHPDFRGRGYGAALMRAVAQRMLDEGDTPFLHTYADNAGAIALYRSLGFEVRAEIIHAVWARA